MADLYFAIADATERNLNAPKVASIPTIEAYIDACRAMYDHVELLGADAVKLAARSTEFHTFGVVGAPGGEKVAQSIWSTSHMIQFFSMISGASTGIIIDGIPAMLTATPILDTIYTANTSLLNIAVESVDLSSIDNVVTLTWDELRASPPKVDIVGVMINFLSDEDVLDALMNSLNVGGVLLVSNASNGSEMYVAGGTDSFAEAIHREIIDSGKFYSLHLQGYVSYSCFIKHSE